MIILFEDADIEELIITGTNKKYKRYAKNKRFVEDLREVYETMRAVETASDLANFSFLHYEKLKFNYSGLSSVRISNQNVERLIFREEEEGVTIVIIELDNTHYGNKK